VAHHQFTLRSGRRIGVSVLGDPLATRLVVLCLPTPGAGAFDPDPQVTAREPVRLIEIDRPGYGSSDPLDENPTVERFADDIAEYLESITVQARELSGLDYGPAAVIGWSFGAAVAASLAAQHPSLIDRVVIVAAPSPKKMRSGERFSVISEARKHGIERTFDSLKSSLDDDGRPELVNLGVDDGDPALEPLGVRGRVDRMLDASWSQQSAGIATDRLAVRNCAWLDTSKRVTQRTLLVYGESDVLGTPRDAAWYRRSIHCAEQLIFSGAGHLVLLTAWAQILQWVSNDHAAQRGMEDAQIRREASPG